MLTRRTMLRAFGIGAPVAAVAAAVGVPAAAAVAVEAAAGAPSADSAAYQVSFEAERFHIPQHGEPFVISADGSVHIRGDLIVAGTITGTRLCLDAGSDDIRADIASRGSLSVALERAYGLRRSLG